MVKRLPPSKQKHLADVLGVDAAELPVVLAEIDAARREHVVEAEIAVVEERYDHE